MDKHDKDQVANDDQELANVLAEVTGAGGTSTSDEPAFIEPPVPSDDAGVSDGPAEDTSSAVLDTSPEMPPVMDQPLVPEPSTPMPEPEVQVAPEPAPMMDGMHGDLDSIKQQAITELRPLVDKLNVSPEEKFDTFLLLIRSTDDRSLIAPAHQAAREIMDESRKAKALLDIIKEVDYLSNNQ